MISLDYLKRCDPQNNSLVSGFVFLIIRAPPYIYPGGSARDAIRIFTNVYNKSLVDANSRKDYFLHVK